jgi:hypothetical protein
MQAGTQVQLLSRRQLFGAAGTFAALAMMEAQAGKQSSPQALSGCPFFPDRR